MTIAPDGTVLAMPGLERFVVLHLKMLAINHWIKSGLNRIHFACSVELIGCRNHVVVVREKI